MGLISYRRLKERLVNVVEYFRFKSKRSASTSLSARYNLKFKKGWSGEDSSFWLLWRSPYRNIVLRTHVYFFFWVSSRGQYVSEIVCFRMRRRNAGPRFKDAACSACKQGPRRSRQRLIRSLINWMLAYAVDFEEKRCRHDYAASTRVVLYRSVTY
jgi:hypothetical protein